MSHSAQNAAPRSSDELFQESEIKALEEIKEMRCHFNMVSKRQRKFSALIEGIKATNDDGSVK